MQLDVNTDESFRSFLPGQKQEDDSALIIEFFLGKKLMGAKSVAAGREIYEDREFVRIHVKGQDKQVVVREVTPQDRDRFPIAYRYFQAAMPAPVVGTPIEQLPGIGPSMAHMLKGLNLRTIEDLARVTDENTLSRIGMGARELVNRAKAFVQQQAPEVVNLQEENAALKHQLEAQAAQIASIQAQLAAPRKRGRKSKPEPAALQ